jgi:hypothetical protein
MSSIARGKGTLGILENRAVVIAHCAVEVSELQELSDFFKDPWAEPPKHCFLAGSTLSTMMYAPGMATCIETYVPSGFFRPLNSCHCHNETAQLLVFLDAQPPWKRWHTEGPHH